MDGLCNQFFPCPALSVDVDGRIGPGYLNNRLQNPSHLLALGHNIGEVESFREKVFQPLDLRVQPAVLESPLNLKEEVPRVKGFRHVAVGPFFMASTALSIVPYAVRIMTGNPEGHGESPP